MPHADTIPNIDLAPIFTDPTWMTRNVRYPVSEAEENQFGAAPHRDHSFLTLLPISNIPGLEVMPQNGNWISADYVDDDSIEGTGSGSEAGSACPRRTAPRIFKSQRPVGTFGDSPPASLRRQSPFRLPNSPSTAGRRNFPRTTPGPIPIRTGNPTPPVECPGQNCFGRGSGA